MSIDSSKITPWSSMSRPTFDLHMITKQHTNLMGSSNCSKVALKLATVRLPTPRVERGFGHQFRYVTQVTVKLSKSSVHLDMRFPVKAASDFNKVCKPFRDRFWNISV